MFEELQKRLQIGKDAYAMVVSGIDTQLKALVSRDPLHLKGAKALQALYPHDPTPLALAAAEQPATDAAPAAAPKTKRARTPRTTKAKK